jgi:hypothetical protein
LGQENKFQFELNQSDTELGASFYVERVFEGNIENDDDRR